MFPFELLKDRVYGFVSFSFTMDLPKCGLVSVSSDQSGNHSIFYLVPSVKMSKNLFNDVIDSTFYTFSKFITPTTTFNDAIDSVGEYKQVFWVVITFSIFITLTTTFNDVIYSVREYKHKILEVVIIQLPMPSVNL